MTNLLKNTYINNFLDNANIGRREFITTLGGIAVLAAGASILSSCATTTTPPIKLTEEMSKTLPILSYIGDNGETVYVPKLEGDWDLDIFERGRTYYQKANIKQEKNKIIGTKTSGGVVVTSEFLRGILEPNYIGFRELYANSPPWAKVFGGGSISPDLNTISYMSISGDVTLHRLKK